MVARGFSLVEVIVAMTLLSVALLGVAGSGMLAARLMREAEMSEQMANRALSVRDSLLAYRITGNGQLSGVPYRIAWTATVDGVTVVGSLPDGTRIELNGAR